jgi:hypothetical protein
MVSAELRMGYDVAALIAAQEASVAKRGSYKKRAA